MGSSCSRPPRIRYSRRAMSSHTTPTSSGKFSSRRSFCSQLSPTRRPAGNVRGCGGRAAWGERGGGHRLLLSLHLCCMRRMPHIRAPALSSLLLHSLPHSCRLLANPPAERRITLDSDRLADSAPITGTTRRHPPHLTPRPVPPPPLVPHPRRRARLTQRLGAAQFAAPIAMPMPPLPPRPAAPSMVKGLPAGRTRAGDAGRSQRQGLL